MAKTEGGRIALSCQGWNMMEFLLNVGLDGWEMGSIVNADT